MLAWDIATPSAVAVDDDDAGTDGPEFEEDMELAADDDFDDGLDDDDLDADLDDDDDDDDDLDDDEFEEEDYEEYEEYEEFADGDRRPHHAREKDWDG